MKLIFLFFFSIGLTYGQSGQELAVGYADRYDSLPEIHIEIAEKQLYERTAPAAKMIFSHVSIKKNTLIVPTGKGLIKLKKYDDSPRQDDGFRGWQYMGYLPRLQMHALVSHSVSEHLGFSDMVLLDSATSDQYGIVSIGDAAVSLPIHSPDGRFLAYYYNHVYERNSCFIGLLEIRDGMISSHARISEMASFQTKNWAVEDMRWVDNTSFIVKTYVLKGRGVLGERQYTYYLARLNSAIKKTK
ncbi:hypothetical protein [Sphingobacterium anhuiense]|uniref:Uncharacterized protein n=1 Tax=Sphingobacterium anhuiense TaxID=493780 RepID=A0ABW5YPE6_9SPHI